MNAASILFSTCVISSDIFTPTVPARIITKPQPVSVLEGETIEVVVTFEGIPEPRPEWSVNGQILSSDDRHLVSSTSETVTLTIPKSQVSDSCVFTLTVANDLGMDTCDVEVTVNKRKLQAPRTYFSSRCLT